MRRFITRPFQDLIAAVDQSLAGSRPALALALCGLSLTLAWFVYVPIHELLHVLGCVATGGSVSELQMQPIYGARWLARIFPFVVPGGDLAGRLSGFDTHGSDFTYLSAVALPYLPSILLGVPLLQAQVRRPRPLWLGPAVVLAFAPLVNLPGDYFEMGSILATRAAAIAGGSAPIESLRSDDLFALVAALWSDPASLGVETRAALAWGIVALALLLALPLAFATYAAGDAFSRALGARRARAEAGDES